MSMLAPMATGSWPGVEEAVATRTSLEVPDLGFNDWRRLGELLEQQRDANLWWIADWALAGEERYRRDYGPALEQIYARQSLHDLVYVARHVAPERRRDDLSFSHHREIASLEPDWQTVWLDDAQTHGWSTRELRQRISEWRGHGRSPTPALTIRAVAELHDLCVAAAERVGLDPAEWARQTLEHAARLALANG